MNEQTGNSGELPEAAGSACISVIRRLDERQIKQWAFDGAPTRILRALCRAWVHADLLPQNAGQYRSAVLEPALSDAVADAEAKGLIV